MDDPAEQAHFRKIVAAFFFYQVSSSCSALFGFDDQILTRSVFAGGRLKR